MAAMMTSRCALPLLLLIAGCDQLQGVGGPETPLVTFQIAANGVIDCDGCDTSNLKVALVWGMQWLTEPLCILPAENDQVQAVINAGCRDPFGFVPDDVAGSSPIELGATTTLSLEQLPSTEVLVGDVTARVAYGSFVLYDDLDDDDTLKLARPDRLGGRGSMPPTDTQPTQLHDIVYGAGFVTMTAPDQRVAYREGGFDTTAAFYPRAGCGAPLPAFSIVSAGGFTEAAAIAATENGMLPPEDPATCTETSASTTTAQINVMLNATTQSLTTTQRNDLACTERVSDSSVSYREPPTAEPDLTNRTTACAHIPSFDGTTSDVIQWVVSDRSDESCVGLSHFTLRGCRDDALCAVPDWDITATPPSWWPCPTSSAP